ncbi:MAG: FHA domain-containing protein [Propionicimonas sp.]
MPICPSGHSSAATDFCDTCGLPIPAQAADTPVPPPAVAPLQPPAALVCPACGTPNVADALFCEACGHDFIGGTTPAPTGSPSTPVEQAEAEPAAAELATPSEPAAPAELPTIPADDHPAADSGEREAEAGRGTEPVEGSSPHQPQASPAKVEWIAELWIDPDWYAAQGSTDPLPSPGLPDIVPLVKDTNLIGRISTSRNIYPEIDCELDTGCSRRHARLTTDGSRWWVEDLESANGTFLGTAAGPLPAMPIPHGKVELAPDQRIYLGAWTRIVVRRATEDEQAAFAGLTS